MMLKRLTLPLALAAFLLSGAAEAQSNPGLVFGQVPSAAQWNSYFSAKQNVIILGPSTVYGNPTAQNAAPSGLLLPACNSNFSALIWTPAIGFGCNNLSSAGLGNVTGPNGATIGYVPQYADIAGRQLSAGLPVATSGANTIVETGAGGIVLTSVIPVGKSVADPGTGVLEALLPIQTATGASKAFSTVDLQLETRRSNSGSAMTDGFPASGSQGMVNGTQITVNNFDATATDTISAGAGTTFTIGGSSAGSYAHPPGRSIRYVYDAPNTTWRATLNTSTELLAPNNLSDLLSASTARTNLGLGTSATISTGTSGATIPLNNGGFTQSGTANFSGAFQISGAAQSFPASGTIVGISDTQTLTNKTISGSTNMLSNIGNAALTNSSVTVNGTPCTLGSSCSPATSATPSICTIASAATVNLGSCANGAIVTVTGTTTITSFGSTAAAGSVYHLQFAGNLNVTSSATLNLPKGAGIITGGGTPTYDCEVPSVAGTWWCSNPLYSSTFSISAAGAVSASSTVTAADVSVNSATTPANGINTPSGGDLGFYSSSVKGGTLDISQRWLLGYTADQGGGQKLQVNGSEFLGGGALTLGTSGTSAASVVFNNATSGAITLAPPLGALGTPALILPDTSGTLIASATALTGAVTGTPTSSNFLRGDGTWATPSGAGNVSGPGSSTGGFFPTWSGTSGTTLTVGIAGPASGTLLGSVTAPAANPVTGTPSSTTFLRGDGTWATPSTSGGLTVGTTTISSGTNGSVEFNNSGILGEKATVGTGSVVLASSASTTVNGSSCALGSSCTPPAAPSTCTIASASTVDLGTCPNGAVVMVTGTTTITSFGSTAAAGSSYLVAMSGNLILTNSTTLRLPGNGNASTGANIPVYECLVITTAGSWSCGGPVYNFGANLTPGGAANVANINVQSSSVPPDGLYLPATNSLGFATSTTLAGEIDASQRWLLGYTSDQGGGQKLQVNGSELLGGGVLTLGTSGSAAGSLVFNNATTGTVTLNVPTGALGTVTATLPDNTGTVAETNLAQTWSAVQTHNSGDLALAGSTSGSTVLNASATASGTLTLPAATGTIVASATALPGAVTGTPSSSNFLRGDGTWAAPTGGAPAGSTTDVQYNSSGSFAGNGGFVYDGTSAVTLGVAGTSIGSVALQNATSGSVKIQPTTGALGAVTATLPANSGTLSELNLAQTWTALQTFPAGTVAGGSSVPGLGTGTGTTGIAYKSADASIHFISAGLDVGFVDGFGHWQTYSGTYPLPTIATNACGSTTQGTIATGSTDMMGKVTVGTASVTTCTVSFFSPFTVAPISVQLTPANSGAAAAVSVSVYVSAISTTGFTITGTALASDSFYYRVN